MRLIFTILFLWCASAQATNYYVDTLGNDGNNGLTTGTAWKTIAKVTAYGAATGFLPGDSILFKRGHSFTGKLVLVSSGSTVSPIVISSYGTGQKPVISGYRQIILTSDGGNIYSGFSSGLVRDLNNIQINGTVGYVARSPNIDSANGGFLTAISATYKTLTTSLTGTPDFSGKKIIVRDSHYTYSKSFVSSQTGGTLNLRDSLTYDQLYYGSNGYFFQNDSAFLDRQNEWYHDSATLRLKIYSTTTPVVYESIVDTLIKLSHVSNIKLLNLNITGSNWIGIQVDSCQRIVIDSDSMHNISKRGIDIKQSRRVSFTNSYLINVLSNAIFARNDDPYSQRHECDTCVVSGNTIKNIGMLLGMEQYLRSNARHESIALMIYGDSNTIENNRFDSLSYIGIFWVGKTKVYRNHGSNYCANRSDGSFIYTNLGRASAGKNAGSLVRSNHAVNGLGFSPGSTGSSFAAGIYFDVASKGTQVDSNFCYNGIKAVYYLFGADSINAHDNLFVNNTGNVFQYATLFGYTATSGNINKNNVYYTTGTDAYTRALINFDGVSNLGILDSNFYLKPADQTYPVTLTGNPITYAQFLGSFGGNHDLHSSLVPATYSYIVPNSQVVVYNPTQADSTVALSGRYVDVKTGRYYTDGITLKPFQSALLFKVIPIITGTVRNLKYKIF